VYPLVRLRAPSSEQDPQFSSLTFGFIAASEYLQPSNAISPPRSMASDAGTSPPRSPHDLRRVGNYTDGLLFDHLTATLGLRRIFVDVKPKDQPFTVPGAASLGSASISFPGISSPIRLGTSPSLGSTKNLSVSPSGPSQQQQYTRPRSTQFFEHGQELTAAEHTVMSWNLRRPWDGKLIQKLVSIAESPSIAERLTKAEYTFVA
jgi:hypothetical protein